MKGSVAESGLAFFACLVAALVVALPATADDMTSSNAVDHAKPVPPPAAPLEDNSTKRFTLEMASTTVTRLGLFRSYRRTSMLDSVGKKYFTLSDLKNLLVYING